MTPGEVSHQLTVRVVRHLETILNSGEIEQGGRLPSERTVAGDLRVSRNTVTAAYNELELRGLLRRIRGKGAYRCHLQDENESFSWNSTIARHARLLDEPILEQLARGCTPGIPYPLSAGTPSLACFPVADYHASVLRVTDSSLLNALSVAPAEGQPKLRHFIARLMGVESDRILITSGAQEAIDLMVRCLIDPGDYAVVESPTYPGAIQCLRAAGARLVGWGTEWSIPELAQIMSRYRPKLLFTTPSFQNPTGKVMNHETRVKLLEIAKQHHVPILEDDVYSRTYLDGRPPPESLLKLDIHSQVLYLSTFSKVLAPGLRVGWIVAPRYMIRQISLMKMRANLFTGGVNQLVLADMIENGSYHRHLDRLREVHRDLRDAALAGARPAAKEGLISFAAPLGSLYLWCRIKGDIDLDDLLLALGARGLSLAPGNAFFPNEPSGQYVRVCYTAADEGKVSKGMEVLKDTLRTLGARRSVQIPYGRSRSA